MAARAKKISGEVICSRYCTIGILSTLTYTEFDCAALLASYVRKLGCAYCAGYDFFLFGGS